MKVKTIAGNFVEIDLDEAMRIHEVVAGNPAASHHQHQKSHSFDFHGRTVELTVPEMKEIANTWWEHYGKSAMEKFFEHKLEKAGQHIAEALDFKEPPETEAEVKGAISRAVSSGNCKLIAEVVYEAMEWQTAAAGLKSFEA